MDQDQHKHITTNKKRTRNHLAAFFSKMAQIGYLRLGLYVLIGLACINLSIMTIHLADDEYAFPLFQHSYIQAIYPNQDVNDTLYTDIIRIEPFDEQTIEEGDLVVLYDDFDISENWVETVVNHHPDTNQIEVTYDNLTTIKVRYDEIIGVYQRDANLIGTIYYTAKFTNGYVLLLGSHVFVVGAYYLGLVAKKERSS